LKSTVNNYFHILQLLCNNWHEKSNNWYEKCNEPFMAKPKNAKTCSQSCRNVLSIGRRLTDNQDVITVERSTIISPVITPELPIKTDKESVITGTPITPVTAEPEPTQKITEHPVIPPKE
jgi:hypothetical protein